MINLRVEIARKIMHLSSSVIGFSVLFFDEEFYVPVLLVASSLVILFDLLRIRYETIRKIFNLFFNVFTRSSENNKITGSSFLFIGASIVTLIFEKEIASAGLLILSFSDSSAAIVGIMFGKTKLFRKTLEGSTAFFITSLIVLNLLGFNIFETIIVAFVVTIVELLSSYKLNDNISIPVSTCITIYLTSLI